MPAPLSTDQEVLLHDWLGAWDTIADYSWPLQDTTVLHVQSGGREFIVKASQSSHHLEREIAAHRDFLGGFRGRVPTLVNASAEHRVLLTEYLPGTLVEGTSAELDPAVYRDAGAVLAQLLVPGATSTTYVHDQVAGIRKNLARATGLLSVATLRALEARIGAVTDEPVQVSFTHGDYQPRNWLMHEGQLRVIDFGRAAQRHWTTDLVRLQNQQFAHHPELERAFSAGLGTCLTSQDQRMLHLATLQEAVGTVVWANSIGDDVFEAHGRGMVERVIASSPP